MVVPRPRRTLSPRAQRRAWSFLVAAVLLFAITRCEAGLPQEAVVRRIVDGDTVELIDGRLVRYIGIDAPEVRRRARPGDREWRAGEDPHWVVDPEPFGQEAMEANRGLVEGKRVRLEYDVETHDRYGRLLAYVFVDGRMANAALLEAGYARLLTIQPNVRYAQRFRDLVKDARRRHRGVWVEPLRPTAVGAQGGHDLRGR